MEEHETGVATQIGCYAHGQSRFMVCNRLFPLRGSCHENFSQDTSLGFNPIIEHLATDGHSSVLRVGLRKTNDANLSLYVIFDLAQSDRVHLGLF